MRTFRIQSLSNFQTMQTAVFAVVIMAHIISPELIYLVSGSLYILTPLPAIPPPPTPCLWSFSIFLGICFFSFTPHIVVRKCFHFSELLQIMTPYRLPLAYFLGIGSRDLWDRHSMHFIRHCQTSAQYAFPNMPVSSPSGQTWFCANLAWKRHLFSLLAHERF